MLTQKEYKLDTCVVKVIFEPKLIKITGSEALFTYLKADLIKNSRSFAKSIKADYLKINGRRLKVTNRSLMVEIWGHLYASRFANVLKAHIDLKLVEKLAGIITKRSDTIDCGEASIDPNRKLWDMLARYYRLISLLL